MPAAETSSSRGSTRCFGGGEAAAGVGGVRARRQLGEELAQPQARFGGGAALGERERAVVVDVCGGDEDVVLAAEAAQLGIEGEDAGELGARLIDLFVAVERDGEREADDRLGAGERDRAAVLVDGFAEAAGGHELVAEVVVHEVLVGRRQAAHRFEAAVLLDGAVEVAGDLAREAEQEGERELLVVRARRSVGEQARALEAQAAVGVLACVEQELAGALLDGAIAEAQRRGGARVGGGRLPLVHVAELAGVGEELGAATAVGVRDVVPRRRRAPAALRAQREGDEDGGATARMSASREVERDDDLFLLDDVADGEAPGGGGQLDAVAEALARDRREQDAGARGEEAGGIDHQLQAQLAARLRLGAQRARVAQAQLVLVRADGVAQRRGRAQAARCRRSRRCRRGRAPGRPSTATAARA